MRWKKPLVNTRNRIHIMRKSTWIIAILASVAAHAGLLWPTDQGNIDTDESGSPAPKPTIALASESVPEPTQALERPEPLPPHQEPQHPMPLEQVVNAPGELDDRDDPGETDSELPDDALPPLQVMWESPDQLRDVAEEMGMRIVAINRGNQIVGEVAMNGAARIIPFEGQLAAYSNRVRTLPRGFFGPGPVSGRDIVSFWILVPADMDARFLVLQRDAIRGQGLRPDEVRSTEAQFQSRQGRHELVITRVIGE